MSIPRLINLLQQWDTRTPAIWWTSNSPLLKGSTLIADETEAVVLRRRRNKPYPYDSMDINSSQQRSPTSLSDLKGAFRSLRRDRRESHFLLKDSTMTSEQASRARQPKWQHYFSLKTSTLFFVEEKVAWTPLRDLILSGLLWSGPIYNSLEINITLFWRSSPTKEKYHH